MRLRNTFLLFTVIVAFNACKKEEEAVPDVIYTPEQPIIRVYVPDNSFKVVAYMPSYKDPTTVADIKYKMITHLFYAFLEPQEAADGSLKALSQQTRFTAVAQKAKANGVKFGISVSGSKTIFENITKSATARTAFVNNIVTFAKNNALDGVDMDWEYPTTTAPINSADNFTLLMRELSAELHKNGKFLSAAVTPGVYAGGIRDGIKAEVLPAIDFVNIMQYDGQTWDKDDPNQHATYKMSVSSTDVWLKQKGLPKEKAIIGIPLYGRNSTGTAKAYRDFDGLSLDLTRDKLTLAGVDYWLNGINTVKLKAQLAKDQGNGIMFWEFSQDTNGANSLIKAANDQIGRAY